MSETAFPEEKLRAPHGPFTIDSPGLSTPGNAREYTTLGDAGAELAKRLVELPALTHTVKDRDRNAVPLPHIRRALKVKERELGDTLDFIRRATEAGFI